MKAEMKLHKIPRVDMSMCCAEQKIAYNMAFRANISFGDKFKSLSTEEEKAAMADKIADVEMKCYRDAYNYKPNKYNEDAILKALKAGLKAYLEKPFIASNFAEVSAAFPLD